jgi:hypothetical protein
MSEADEARKMQELQRKLRKRAVAEGVRRILMLLESARRDVLAEIADSDWDRFILPRLTAQLDRQLELWRDLALQDLTAAQAQSWQAGSQSVLSTAGAIGLEVSLPELPTSLLQALTQKMGQRVTGLTQSAKDRLDKALATGLLSGQSREDTIAALGKVLKTGELTEKSQGIFGSISARARFIYQQETGQAYARAQDLRRDQVIKYVPELQKVWVHDGHPLVPRPDHLAMHGQVQNQDEPFRNPVTGEELMFPRDPDADIGETAGCTCDVFLWRDAYGSIADFIGPATGRAAEAA